MPTYDYLCPCCHYLKKNVSFSTYKKAGRAQVYCDNCTCNTLLDRLFPAPNLGRGASATETGTIVKERQHPVFAKISAPCFHYEGPAVLLEALVQRDSRLN